MSNIRVSYLILALITISLSAAQGRSQSQSLTESMPPELVEVNRQLFSDSFSDFVNDIRKAHPELYSNSKSVSAPKFDPNLTRGQWVEVYANWLAAQSSLNESAAQQLRSVAEEMFTSYYHDQSYSRTPFVEASDYPGGSGEIKEVAKLSLPTSFPKNHTLDVTAYVGERFPKALQSFVANQHVQLVIDDSHCGDAVTYQSTLGYKRAYRFMGPRDEPDSQFVFVYDQEKKQYRFVVCDIYGKDDQTRIVAILGPIFYAQGAMSVHHAKAARFFEFNAEGDALKLDAKNDRVVIGFQNTVWWQLVASSPSWQRHALTTAGTDVSVFENKSTGMRIISISNVYGDEMLEVLQTFYAKGARRWIYLGTAGALDPNLQVGDVLLPRRFWKPNGEWLEFLNDAESLNLQVSGNVKRVSATAKAGWQR